MKRIPMLLWLLLVAAIVVWWWRGPVVSSSRIHRHSDSTVPRNPALVEHPDLSSAPGEEDAASARLIEWAWGQFEQEHDRLAAAATMEELVRSLRDCSPNRALAVAASIARFLATGRDVQTGLPFSVGPGGVLSSAPTLRVALLDVLASLDPVAALTLAREIIRRHESPDEYAISLRNLLWNNQEGELDDEVKLYWNRMIETEDWNKNPSDGFLEAMDVGVALGGSESFLRFVELAGEGFPEEVRSAAWMSMDRMVVRDPGFLVSVFEEGGGMDRLGAVERASLMSRLDPTLPEHERVFRAYLERAGRNPEEIGYFAELFPNGNLLQGHWLVTSGEQVPSIEQRRAADERILRVIEGDLKEERPGPQRIALERIRERLVGFLRGE